MSRIDLPYEVNPSSLPLLRQLRLHLGHFVYTGICCQSSARIQLLRKSLLQKIERFLIVLFLC